MREMNTQRMSHINICAKNMNRAKISDFRIGDTKITAAPNNRRAMHAGTLMVLVNGEQCNYELCKVTSFFN